MEEPLLCEQAAADRPQSGLSKFTPFNLKTLLSMMLCVPGEKNITAQRLFDFKSPRDTKTATKSSFTHTGVFS